MIPMYKQIEAANQEIASLSVEEFINWIDNKAEPKHLGGGMFATTCKTECYTYKGVKVRAEGRSTLGRGARRDRAGKSYAVYFSANGKRISQADLAKQLHEI